MTKRIENVRIQLEPSEKGLQLRVVHVGRKGKLTLHRSNIATARGELSTSEHIASVVQSLMDSRLRLPTGV